MTDEKFWKQFSGEKIRLRHPATVESLSEKLEGKPLRLVNFLPVFPLEPVQPKGRKRLCFKP